MFKKENKPNLDIEPTKNVILELVLGVTQNLLQMLLGEQFCLSNHSTVRAVLQERTTKADLAYGCSFSREVYQNEID